MKHTLYTFISIALLFLNACGNSKEKLASPMVVDNEQKGQIWVTNEQFEQGDMQLGKPARQAFPKVIKATGTIDVPPQNRAVVSAIMGGYIKDIPFLVGDAVRKGQALVTIENPAYVNLQQEFLEVSEQIVYLESEYERQKTLVAEKISSQKSFLKAESDFRKAEATRNGLKRQLQMLNISTKALKPETMTSSVTLYAPISGSVTKVEAVTGSFVASTTEIMEIVDNDHIHLELSVFEKDVLNIRKGQEILFQIPESSEETFEGSVYLIGTSIDQNRTVRVHGHLKNEEQHNFLRGMFVDAQILADTDEKTLYMAVPEHCIVEHEGESMVLVLKKLINEGYAFDRLAVTPGRNYGGYTEIISEALSDSTQILIKGAFNLIQAK